MRALLLAAMVLASVACTGGHQAPAPEAASHEPEREVGSGCPVTTPTGDHRARDPAGLGALGFGNGRLWVGLSPDGWVRASRDQVNRQGAITVTFLWDRGVRGRLHVTGRRLDGEAPALRARVPNRGPQGPQPTELIFPTQGCWRVTGVVGRGPSLTFVTLLTVSPGIGPH